MPFMARPNGMTQSNFKDIKTCWPLPCEDEDATKTMLARFNENDILTCLLLPLRGGDWAVKESK